MMLTCAALRNKWYTVIQFVKSSTSVYFYYVFSKKVKSFPMIKCSRAAWKFSRYKARYIMRLFLSSKLTAVVLEQQAFPSRSVRVCLYSKHSPHQAPGCRLTVSVQNCTQLGSIHCIVSHVLSAKIQSLRVGRKTTVKSAKSIQQRQGNGLPIGIPFSCVLKANAASSRILYDWWEFMLPGLRCSLREKKTEKENNNAISHNDSTIKSSDSG